MYVHHSFTYIHVYVFENSVFVTLCQLPFLPALPPSIFPPSPSTALCSSLSILSRNRSPSLPSSHCHSLHASHMQDQGSLDLCTPIGFRYVGLQYHRQCFCGNSYNRFRPLPLTACGAACSGNQTEMCGGNWKLSVYEIPTD